MGKIPPQAQDMEAAVLGAMLISSQHRDEILSMLKPESFYSTANGEIFQAIISLATNNKPVDLITVTEELRRMKKLEEVGGPVYVTKLTSAIASGSHIEYHASIVQECYIKRELIRIGEEIANTSFDESADSEEIISFANQEIGKIVNDSAIDSTEILKNLVHERVKQIEEIAKYENKLLGVPSGLTKLDRLTGGWQKTDLIILAARPSVGKTSLSLFMALQAAEYKFPVVFFSLEMSKMQLVDKVLSASTELSPVAIRTAKMDWRELENGVSRCYDLGIYIDDTPALTLLKLRSKIMRLLRHKIQAVFIDYLQLMNGRSKGLNRDQEIGELTRGIKAIAKEANVPIILLSQLNRAADGKRPVLSNLRESGNIEQDADLVMFMHRPEGIGTDGDSSKIELIIAKHRNGPVGMIELYANEYSTKFTDNYFSLLNPEF